MSQSSKVLAASLVLVLGVSLPGVASDSNVSQSNASSVLLNKSKGSSNAEIQPRFLKKFTAKRITRLAMTNFNKFVSANRKTKPYKIVFEDGFSEFDRKWIERLALATVSALPFQEGYVPLIVAAGSDEFINETLRANGKSGNSAAYWCGRPTSFEAYCAGAGWAAMNYKYSLESGSPIGNPGKRAVVAHEIYHVWHKTVDGSIGNNNVDPRLPNGFPLWFAEGNANFFGFAMAQNALRDPYVTGRLSQVDAYMNTSLRPLKEHVFWDTNPYGIGQAAAEYLVASVGMQKVMDVYGKVGSGKTFAAAFQESIGISVEEFFTLFESVRGNFTRW